MPDTTASSCQHLVRNRVTSLKNHQWNFFNGSQVGCQVITELSETNFLLI